VEYARDEDMVFKACSKCGQKTDLKIYKGSTKLLQYMSGGNLARVPGYSEPGYNEGLGQVVTDKKDYYDKASKIGATPIE